MLRLKTLLLAPLFALATAACGGAGEPVTFVSSPGSTPPPAPTVSLAANPTSVASGSSSMLTWSSMNATSCTSSGAWGVGPTALSNSTGWPTLPLTTTSNYSLTCTGPGGSASALATVTVSGTPPPPPVPTVSLTANPTSVASGASSTLTWLSTNATSCTSSGAWDVGPKALSNSTGQSTGALISSSTFSLSCTGLGGTASVSATVTVTTGTPSYTTTFGVDENPISEGGVWRRLSGNVFTNVRTANGIAFGTNGARDDYDDSYALLSGFGPDQTAEAVVFRSTSLVSGPITHEVELLLRFSDDATTARGYECTFNYAGNLAIVRWNGTMGDFTALSLTGAGAGSLGRDLMTGDVVKATIIGNRIRSYINGNLMIEAIDSTYATGQPGIAFFTRPLGVNDNPNFGFTSYTVSSN